MKAPKEGGWYWVTDGKEVWPAMRRAASAGGWTNTDTWEDFNSEVIAWRALRKPSPKQIASLKS